MAGKCDWSDINGVIKERRRLARDRERCVPWLPAELEQGIRDLAYRMQYNECLAEMMLKRLDLQRILGPSPATQKVYSVTVKQFASWCLLHGRELIGRDRLPDPAKMRVGCLIDGVP